MKPVETAESGVINADTVFEFSQLDEHIWASYSGGLIERGYLVGILRKDKLAFRYCQIQTDGTLDGGHSDCKLRLSESRLIQIVEKFEWESRSGSGVNIIQEFKKSDLIS